MSNPQSFLDEVRRVDSLPSPPNVAVQILELCQDPNISLQELGKVLALDAALAARVLRISNSAAYSRGREVTSLPQAIMTLGARNISIVALGFSLKSAVPAWEHDSGMTDSLLWRHNVATAVTARGLARLIRVPDHEMAFLCGLMSRIGQLLLYSIAPREYGEVLSAAAGKLPSAEIERQMLGMTHHEAGGLLLQKWGLPSAIHLAVSSWGQPERTRDVPDAVKQLASIVTVSDALAELVFDADKATELDRIHEIAAAELGASDGEVDRMFAGCGQDIQETLAIFDLPFSESIDCEAVMERARQQLVNVSLGLIADLNAAQDNTSSLIEQNRQLAEATVRDGLTGLGNRSALNNELAALERARAKATQAPAYSIMMIDVDHFKNVNDTYGHPAGDDVLRSVSETLSQCARATDFVARYGGEEFCVVLTNAGTAEASSVAERFRAAIERTRIELQDSTLSITASIGVACSDATNRESSSALLQRADNALYAAKRGGRNRVVVDNSDKPCLARS